MCGLLDAGMGLQAAAQQNEFALGNVIELTDVVVCAAAALLVRP